VHEDTDNSHKEIVVIMFFTGAHTECNFDGRFVATKWTCVYMGDYKFRDTSNPCVSSSPFNPEYDWMTQL
jgi:hypothetical protein